MDEELSRSVVKAQQAVANAAWEVMLCKAHLKDAEDLVAACHENLQAAAVKHGELCSQYEKTHESWRLAVVESLRPSQLQRDLKP